MGETGGRVSGRKRAKAGAGERRSGASRERVLNLYMSTEWKKQSVQTESGGRKGPKGAERGRKGPKGAERG